jgi:hypothetical protein
MSSNKTSVQIVSEIVAQPVMTKAAFPESSGGETKKEGFHKCLKCEVLTRADEKYCWGCIEDED